MVTIKCGDIIEQYIQRNLCKCVSKCECVEYISNCWQLMLTQVDAFILCGKTI